MKKRKTGMVFSGGGAKGAYHLGVWKALSELGLVSTINGVSGSSIGALMGYMFANNQYQYCYDLWYKAAIEKNEITKTARTFRKIMGNHNYNALANLTNNTFLSTKKLKLLLENIVNPNKTNLICKCYVTCHNLKNKKPETFLVNNYDKNNVSKILLASSSMPVLFKKVKIDEMDYLDGGISDNTPIRPLYENGYNIIIVVYLDEKGHIDYRFYPGITFIEIYPKGGIGKFRDGVLNFYHEKIDYLMEKGYREGYSVLQKNLELLKKEFID